MSGPDKRWLMLYALSFGISSAGTLLKVQEAWKNSYLYPPRPQEVANAEALLKQSDSQRIQNLVLKSTSYPASRKTHIKNNAVRLGNTGAVPKKNKNSIAQKTSKIVI